MNPQSPLAGLQQAINANPGIGQATPASPSFEPGLQTPPTPPMPNKTPYSEIHNTHPALHRSLLRKGITLPGMQVPQPSPTPPQGQTPLESSPTAPGNMPQEQDPQGEMPISEAELIIKALTDRMKTIGKHESAVRDHLFPNQSH